MRKIEKVLITSDGLEGMEWALEKAVYIEHFTGASLEVLEVIYNYIEETPSRFISEEKRARIVEQLLASEQHVLESYAARIKERVAGVKSSVQWNKKPAAAILLHAKENDVDLIIKPVSRHHLIRDYVNAPVDWEIMRHSPCPVLVTKDQSWSDTKIVLAALDITDEHHESLNRTILESAVALTSTLDAELHLTSVYPDMGQEVSNYQVAVDFVAAKEDMRHAREEMLGELVTSAGLENVGIHVHAGSPAKVIAQLAEEIEPTVTVLGTVARHGAGKLFFGNTSESLIPRLQGDILCVHDV